METIFVRFTTYLRLEKALASSTIAEYLRAVTGLYWSINDDVLIRLRSYSQIAQAIITLSEQRQWSAVMRYKVASILVIFFTWAHREGIIGTNPFPRHDFRKPPATEPEYFQTHELPPVVCHPHYTLRDLTMFALLADTGIRRNELRQLNVEDVHLSERVLMIHETKQHRYRSVPFTRQTARLVRFYLYALRLHYDGDVFFPTVRWQRMNKDQVSKHIKALGERSSPKRNGTKVYPHKFRHSLASRLILNGADLSIAQKILGHSTLSMTARYTHYTTKQLRTVYDKVQPVLGKA